MKDNSQSSLPRSLWATELLRCLDKVHHQLPSVKYFSAEDFSNHNFFMRFCPLFNLKFAALRVFKILPGEEQTAALTPHCLIHSLIWVSSKDLLKKKSVHLFLMGFGSQTQAGSCSSPELEELTVYCESFILKWPGWISGFSGGIRRWGKLWLSSLMVLLVPTVEVTARPRGEWLMVSYSVCL